MWRKKIIQNESMTAVLDIAAALQRSPVHLGQYRLQRHRKILPPSIGNSGSRLKIPWIRAQIPSNGKRRTNAAQRKLAIGPAAAQSSSSFAVTGAVWIVAPPMWKEIPQIGTRKNRNNRICPASCMAAAR